MELYWMKKIRKDVFQVSVQYSDWNLQWIHKDLQRMKNNMNEHVFVDWCRRIAKHKEKT